MTDVRSEAAKSVANQVGGKDEWTSRASQKRCASMAHRMDVKVDGKCRANSEAYVVICSKGKQTVMMKVKRRINA